MVASWQLSRLYQKCCQLLFVRTNYVGVGMLYTRDGITVTFESHVDVELPNWDSQQCEVGQFQIILPVWLSQKKRTRLRAHY